MKKKKNILKMVDENSKVDVKYESIAVHQSCRS